MLPQTPPHREDWRHVVNASSPTSHLSIPHTVDTGSRPIHMLFNYCHSSNMKIEKQLTCADLVNCHFSLCKTGIMHQIDLPSAQNRFSHQRIGEKLWTHSSFALYTEMCNSWLSTGKHAKVKALPSKATRWTTLMVTNCRLYMVIVSSHSRKTCEWEVRESKQSRPAGDRALRPDTGKADTRCALARWRNAGLVIAEGRRTGPRPAANGTEWNPSQGQGHKSILA